LGVYDQSESLMCVFFRRLKFDLSCQSAFAVLNIPFGARYGWRRLRRSTPSHAVNWSVSGHYVATHSGNRLFY